MSLQSAAKKRIAHPGFQSVQNKIAAQKGISHDRAGAILAASTRKASAKAKAANPRLKRVLGKTKSNAGSTTSPHQAAANLKRMTP